MDLTTWDDGLTELQYDLASRYLREVLDLDGAPTAEWYNVLPEVANRGMAADLVTIASRELLKAGG